MIAGALARVAAWLCAGADALGKAVLAPIALLPGWLSATLIAAATGVFLLIIFKYTSNQPAIQRARNDVNAHLLALKLFKDSARVTVRAQGRILWGAARLAAGALLPMIVMFVPVTLFLGQLALWYQARPLQVGETAVATLALGGATEAPWPVVRLAPTDAVEVAVGPVRVRSRREISWELRALKPGIHPLNFEVDGQPRVKQIAIGPPGSFMRVSARRPGWDASDIVLNPAEPPFPPGEAVRSIAIDYPGRSSWTSGTDWWAAYWFAGAFVSALCFRRALNVAL